MYKRVKDEERRALGEKCFAFRRGLQISRARVAKETGYSIESIAAFEQGRTDSAFIYMWYVNHGFREDSQK